MKKKHRKIVVNGTEYAWSLGSKMGDGSTKVNIWKDKQIFGSDWILAEEITPSRVRKSIEMMQVDL